MVYNTATGYKHKNKLATVYIHNIAPFKHRHNSRELFSYSCCFPACTSVNASRAKADYKLDKREFNFDLNKNG